MVLQSAIVQLGCFEVVMQSAKAPPMAFETLAQTARAPQILFEGLSQTARAPKTIFEALLQSAIPPRIIFEGVLQTARAPRSIFPGQYLSVSTGKREFAVLGNPASTPYARLFRLVRAGRWPTLRGMKPARIAPDTGPFSAPPTASEMQASAADVESLRGAGGVKEGIDA